MSPTSAGRSSPRRARACGPPTRNAVTRRVASVRPDDTVTVLYTSGTTGNPKGVRLTHRNVLYEMAAVTLAAGGTVEPGGLISPPPAADGGPPPSPPGGCRTCRWRTSRSGCTASTGATAGGGHVYFCDCDVAALAAATAVVRPTGFFGVPRIWEKIQAAIKAGLATKQDPARRAAVARAREIGLRYIEGTQMGRSVPAPLAEAFRQADEQVLQPIRAYVGLGAAATRHQRRGATAGRPGPVLRQPRVRDP